MERFFSVLEETMNKSSITQFRRFVGNYLDVTKWFMCSDYCFDDMNKANNVISFIIYPYILDFKEWSSIIDSMQKRDLKHSRSVSSSFCKFLKSGYFFCFSFILDKNCIIDKWKDKATMEKAIQDWINITRLWQDNTPKNIKRYKTMEKRLKDLQCQTNRKSFNYKLLGRIVGISFLASYLKYLLLREVPNIEIFSWMSDRDAITSWNHEIYLVIYQLISHCLISNTLTLQKNNGVMELAVENINENMFHDSLNRVADFICGAIADFNYSDGSVTGTKHCKLIEDAISDNDYLIILKISENDVACGLHKKINK